MLKRTHPIVAEFANRIIILWCLCVRLPFWGVGLVRSGVEEGWSRGGGVVFFLLLASGEGDGARFLLSEPSHLSRRLEGIFLAPGFLGTEGAKT